MSLKQWLASAQYDAEREQQGADVIPLRAFDPSKCEAEIKRLDVKFRELSQRILDERRTYEETIGVMENELEAIRQELSDRRKDVRDWAEHLGALSDARSTDTK